MTLAPEFTEITSAEELRALLGAPMQRALKKKADRRRQVTDTRTTPARVARGTSVARPLLAALHVRAGPCAQPLFRRNWR